MKLIATQPFGDYQVGAEITDEAKVSKILSGEQAAFVVKVNDIAPATPDAGNGSKTK